MVHDRGIILNGKAYDWGTIELFIQGVPIIGISNISLEDKMTTDNLYGTGPYVTHRGYGHIESNVSITLNADEIFALQNVAINGILSNLPPFDIIITMMLTDVFSVNPISIFSYQGLADQELARLVTNKLPKTFVVKNCQFTNNGFSVNQGDMNIETTFSLIATHIVWKPISIIDQNRRNKISLKNFTAFNR